MRRRIAGLIFCLAALAISPGLQAQYHWRILHPNQIDTFYYYFDVVSCFGNNYIGVGARFALPATPDQYLVAHSSDGGQTWNDCFLPRKPYVTPYIFYDAQQIGSFDGIAIGTEGAFFYTKDGWSTAVQDSALSGYLDLYNQWVPNGIYHICDFSNTAEGIISGSGLFWTMDSGSRWIAFDSANDGFDQAKSYGSGKFRVVMPQPRPPDNGFLTYQMVLTTQDYWATTDTSLIQYTGPLSDTEKIYRFYFGKDDTLFVLGVSDSAKRVLPPMLAVSPDLGQHWNRILLPKNVPYNPQVSRTDRDTFAIYGADSGGLVLLTFNGGKTWIEDSIPTPLYDSSHPFYFIENISVGEGGAIIASLDVTGPVPGTGGGVSGLVASLELNASDVQQTKKLQGFYVYPNPATEVLNIGQLFGIVSILDPLGRAYSVPRTGDQLDVSSLPAGIYFVTDGRQSAKFVKE